MGEVFHFSKEILKEVIQETLVSLDSRVANLEAAVISREDITDIVEDGVTKGLEKHPCWLVEDDRAMVKDMVTGGKYVKKSMLMALSGAIIYAVAKVVLSIKVGK